MVRSPIYFAADDLRRVEFAEQCIAMIGYFKKIVKNSRRSVLARNTGWMFLGYGLRIFVQAGYFILIARTLGPSQYGAFVGAVALIAIIAPFASLGAGDLLVKNVSRDKRVFSEYWGNALFMTAVSGIVFLGVVILAARLVLPGTIAWSLIILISVSDLILVKGSDIAAQAFQAVDQHRYTATLNLLPSFLRLVGAAILFILWHRSTAMRWGWFYLGGTLISSAFAVVLTNRKLGKPKLALDRIRKEMAEGLYFGTSLSAQTIYNDIDKAMLARLATLDATGIYAAAYRLIDVAFTPVRSVLYASYPAFFREGQEGMAASFSYAKQLMPKMVAYSLLSFAGLFIAAPIIPRVLGSEYLRTVEALRWLALLPLLKTIHYFLANSLTGAGYQGVRTSAQILVAVLNVVLNLWLIPTYSWRGAAWASIICDATLALSLYAALMFVMARENRLVTQFSGEHI
jgi:O-antigen/teichoic acid export membrane protein